MAASSVIIRSRVDLRAKIFSAYFYSSFICLLFLSFFFFHFDFTRMYLYFYLCMHLFIYFRYEYSELPMFYKDFSFEIIFLSRRMYLFLCNAAYST